MIAIACTYSSVCACAGVRACVRVRACMTVCVMICDDPVHGNALRLDFQFCGVNFCFFKLLIFYLSVFVVHFRKPRKCSSPDFELGLLE